MKNPIIMTALTRRKIKFFSRLNYPLEMVMVATSAGEWQIIGHYPDLPGCKVSGSELESVKADLEKQRLAWLERHISTGETPPMPNSHVIAHEPTADAQ